MTTQEITLENTLERTSRIVTLEDGSQVNFGVRANLLTFIEDNVITFKLVTARKLLGLSKVLIT
jgi:hypothetical protein